MISRIGRNRFQGRGYKGGEGGGCRQKGRGDPGREGVRKVFSKFTKVRFHSLEAEELFRLWGLESGKVLFVTDPPFSRKATRMQQGPSPPSQSEKKEEGKNPFPVIPPCNDVWGCA